MFISGISKVAYENPYSTQLNSAQLNSTQLYSTVTFSTPLYLTLLNSALYSYFTFT